MEMSDQQTCLMCGGIMDNEDETGYCTACATDFGVYEARAGDQTSNDSVSLDDLHVHANRILGRLADAEARLADTEERLRLLEERDRVVAEASAGHGPEGAADETKPAPAEPPAATLAERACAMGVDYTRLRKLYSEEELRKLLDDHSGGR
jgi:hypothetical protein